MNALPCDHYEACSAGTEPSHVNPYAIKSMSEIDIDISTNRSKNIHLSGLGEAYYMLANHLGF